MEFFQNSLNFFDFIKIILKINFFKKNEFWKFWFNSYSNEKNNFYLQIEIFFLIKKRKKTGIFKIFFYLNYEEKSYKRKK